MDRNATLTFHLFIRYPAAIAPTATMKKNATDSAGESGHLAHEPDDRKKPFAHCEQRHGHLVDAYPVPHTLAAAHASGGSHATMYSQSTGRRPSATRTGWQIASDSPTSFTNPRML